MSVVIITGDHPRHLYFAHELCKSGMVCGIIYERRGNFMLTADDYGVVNAHIAELTNYHFKARAEAEEQFFHNCSKVSSIPILTVDVSELNSPKVMAFLQAQKPKLVLSYGCHKLSDELMNSVAPCRFWNTHGGLSPDYRGVTTHFWPSYMLEVEMTGMTLHETTDKIDGGSVIFQTGYELTKDDTLHMVACRTLEFYTQKMIDFLKDLNYEDLPFGITQKTSGKIWMNSDWRPEHLALIYDIYKDNIVNLTLKGEILGRKPKLINVLTKAQ